MQTRGQFFKRVLKYGLMKMLSYGPPFGGLVWGMKLLRARSKSTAHELGAWFSRSGIVAAHSPATLGSATLAHASANCLFRPPFDPAPCCQWSTFDVAAWRRGSVPRRQRRDSQLLGLSRGSRRS